jgi:hypothetical protein
MQKDMVLNCHLIKGTRMGIWQQLAQQITIGMFSTGLVIRQAFSGTLLIDLPRVAIVGIEIISGTLARIYVSEEKEKIAIRFCSDEDGLLFSTELHRYGIPCVTLSPSTMQRNKKILPDLQDPLTQELLLNILFSDTFQEFGRDLSGVLCQMKSVMKG